jgi:hypothetical protein
VIYYSGHGHTNLGPVWLLSDAPELKEEAVSLVLSEAAARNCLFSHVVFISDACRVPTGNLQFGNVSGSSIFPNLPPSDHESQPVDQFFGSVLGGPALEVAIDGKPSSIYTKEFAHALSGLDDELLEPEKKESASPVVVRAWPLKKFLPGVITRRLLELKVKQKVIPDERYTGCRPWCVRWPGERNRQVV